jgi:UDP-N-acetylmuramate dehydrogenase
LSKIENYNFSYQALKEALLTQSNVTLALVREKICEIRNRKLPEPEQTGSAGSFFKNPVILREKFEKLLQYFPQLIYYEENEENVKLAAAQLIEFCGWKGFREGDAGVYPFQPLALVNYGNATGQDILNLAEKIRQSVLKKFGVKLEYEVNVV